MFWEVCGSDGRRLPGNVFALGRPVFECLAGRFSACRRSPRARYDGETQGAIRKIMFDQNQKALGKPTSEQLKTAEVMKDAWNAPNSPFAGMPFDPSVLNLQGNVNEFVEAHDQAKLDGAIARKQAELDKDKSPK